jgi:small subunit ribosomal protein S4
MSRITLDSKCRLCRTEGVKLYLKGARCFSKCPIDKKGAVPPGMHGIKRKSKPTDYGIQLRAKQKAKRIYGIAETQFKNYYLKAKKLKGSVADNLLTLVERRLDNLIYVSGLSLSRSHSKQLISHGHVLVNGQKLNIPSYLVNINDVISLDKTSIELNKDSLRLTEKDFDAPMWISLNKNKFEAKVISLPNIEEMDHGIDINLIIEYYSR